MIAAILMLLFSTESYSQASKKLVDDYVFVLEEIFNSEDQDTVIFKNLQSHIDVREVSLGEVSLQYVRKGIELARKKGLTDWEAMLYDLLGNVHGTLGEKNNAELAHEKSLALYKETGNLERQTALHTSLIVLYTTNNAAEKALTHGYDALKICQKLNDKKSTAAISMPMPGPKLYIVGQI